MSKIPSKTCGFSLIELLIVVLIIGILAAIAIPAYGTMVEKARAQEAIINLRALFAAQEIHYEYNGHYTDDTNALDITIRGTKFFTYKCWEDRTCGAEPIAHRDYLIEFHSNRGGNNEEQVFYRGKKWCVAQKERGDKVCKALGGKDMHDAGPQWGRYYFLLGT